MIFRKEITLSILLLSILIFYKPENVFAESVWFKHLFPPIAHCSEDEDPQIRGICIPVTLNDSVDTTFTGVDGGGSEGTGPSCEFTIDTRGTGHWDENGGMFDTPEYAWGSYDISSNGSDPRVGLINIWAGRDVNFRPNNIDYLWPLFPAHGVFVCNDQPQYTIDTTSIPSYISFVKEEQGKLGGRVPPDRPKYSRFYFKVNENAPTSGSFTIRGQTNFSCDFRAYYLYTRNCGGGAEQVRGDIHEPVLLNGTDCRQVSAYPQGRNRQANFEVTVNLGQQCVPPSLTPTPPPNSPTPTVTPTGTPTPTPVPTNTPTPTPTPSPTPTNTPTPTQSPTPIPPPACNCEGTLDVISGTIGVDSNFTVRQHGSTTSNAFVKSMIFHVERRVNSGPWEEIANSGEVTAVATTDDPNLYYADWIYRIPNEGSGTYEYHIWVELKCEHKAHAYDRYNTAVLGSATQKGSFFEMIRSFIASLFGSFRGTSKQSGETPFMGPAAPGGDGSMCITGANSPKLCTFYPALNIIKQCKNIYFTVFVP